ncbi:MAG TPA: IPT/TIG domain-containing protein, partial [Bryobacteraceae bacterium]|nr:IPT/TIG domain-containing protein [Bryobacteraceae bacterium]
ETVPVNVYLTQEQLAEAGNFQPTWVRGAISVLAEATATANITVTGGPSPFAVPYIGVGGAGKSGDIATLTQILGPTEIPSGQSVDLAMVGAGYDKNLTDADFRIYGQGIWVHPGSVRVDPNASVNFGSGPLPIVRITLDIAARQQNGMASIFISKGGSTLSLSGLLTLTPPAQGTVNSPPVPTTTLQGLVNAASQLGNGTVSPGEIATVYGNNLAPSGGPYFGGFENAGFDGAGVLSGSFADVTVTFDGVPAPLFFVSSGQINLQVPFEVAGKATTQMVVNYLGSPSPPIAVPVLSIEPALFTYPIPTAAYTGNQDATANTAANPAARGSYITVYGTGLGLPSYPVETGVGAAPTSLSSGGFTCTFGGIPTTVLYAGWTPTSVGLAQFNIQIPESAPTGAVPVVFTNGAAATQANLTVFVK